jgi:hypothetical protein
VLGKLTWPAAAATLAKMIRDYLVPALKIKFPNRDIFFDMPPQPIATFPARQEAVGRVMIYDDGDEATVFIEQITHFHLNEYDERLSVEERERLIAERVIDFLEALFADLVLLYVSPDNRVGGSGRIDLMDESPRLTAGYRYYLWSRPYLADD